MLKIKDAKYLLFKNFTLTVVIPIVGFWTALLIFRYPLPCVDDLFFIGAAINLAKGGEFTNPYLEAWNSALSSGKFYFQPPFHSYILAGWLKITGLSTVSLCLFQYLCYVVFSLSTALVLRFYGFPRLTALCTTILFAIWHCNPNPYYSTGLRQDALGMAFLALGIWLLTRDNCWRYFFGFSFVESAAFTSPITPAYAIPFSIAILTINYIDSQKSNNYNYRYFITKTLIFLTATGLVLFILLLCINFDLPNFISDFILHTSWRRTPTIKAIPLFIKLISQFYGLILIVPSYILFLSLVVITFAKRYCIATDLKILFTALITGMLLNVLLYASSIWFVFFFCWLGILCVISKLTWQQPKKLNLLAVVAVLVFACSQSLNILSLVGREFVPESQYREIKEAVLAQPDRKYAIDEIAARFVFDYKLPKNSITWNFIKPAPAAYPTSAQDKKPDVTWIVSKSNLGHYVPEMQPDYPKVEFMGRRFNSLPKKPFDVKLIP